MAYIHIRDICKKVTLIGFIIGIVGFVIVTLFFNKYILPFIVGTLVSIIFFDLKFILSNYILRFNKKNSVFAIILLYFLCIIFISGIGIYLMSIGLYYIIAYIAGYNVSLISLFIYALQKKYK